MGQTKNDSQEDTTNNVQSLPISEPKLVYNKEGIVRDISKVGPAASESKTISDEQERTLSGNEIIRVKMAEWEAENVKQNDDSKKILE